jgi:NADH-quinone oxidoreductase subunit J
MDQVTAPQVILSFVLLTGVLGGVGCLVLGSLARFIPHRRLLGLIALLGFAMFTYGMLALSIPTMRLHHFYFWLFTAAVIGGGLGSVTMRNVFHAALMLILSLFGVAGYFILVNAEFLAMVQVIIYIGGIMVLFLFGIMVSQNIIGSELKQTSPEAPWAAIGAGVLFLFMMFVTLFMSFPPSQPALPLSNNVQGMGWSLMATYTLPFEAASVMLLMAMMGAIILVRKE